MKKSERDFSHGMIVALPDDYPVYGNYIYVADGKLIMSDWHDITVRQFKAQLGAKEIRRCDMHGRAALSDNPKGDGNE